MFSKLDELMSSFATGERGPRLHPFFDFREYFAPQSFLEVRLTRTRHTAHLRRVYCVCHFRHVNESRYQSV